MYDRNTMDRIELADIWEDTTVDLLERIRNNDTDAIVQFVMEHQDRVKSVVRDVLPDEERAVLATRTTFKNAVRQIQNGVKTGQMEPWLFWIARNEALTLTQAEAPTQRERQDDVHGTTDRAVTPQVRRFPLTRNTSSPSARGHVLRVGQSAMAPERTSEDEANPRLLTELKRLRERNAQLEAEKDQSDMTANAYRAVQPTDSPATPPYRYTPRHTDTPAQPQPPLSRESALPVREQRQEDADRAAESYADQENASKQSGSGASVISILVTCAMMLVILLLVWVVMGLLAKNNIIALPDWGFSWFNQHLFKLF